jgi:hypothetical protein
MTDYVKNTDYAAKDNLLTGNPAKLIKGSELDAEFDDIVTAIASKQDYSDNLAEYAAVNPTAAGLALLDDATSGDQLTTLGGTTVGKAVFVADSVVSAQQAMDVEVGVDVQAYDADLTAFAGKTAPTGDVVGTTDTQTLTNKTISAATNTVEATSGPDGSAFSFRNKIINGGFDVWQRGTSVALNTSGIYTADRFSGFQSATATATVTRQSTGLDGFRYALRLSRDSGSSGTGPINLYQALETANSVSLQGKSVTFSFYARKGANFSAASDLLLASVLSGTGTDEGVVAVWTGSATVVSENKTLTTSWQRFSVTGTVGASATQLRVRFAFTPVGTAGAADYIEITGVQLEAGSVATPFESRPYGVELALCQRYCKPLAYGHDFYAPIASQIDRVTYSFEAMRATPTVGTLTNSNASNATSIAVVAVSANSARLDIQGTATGNVGATGSCLLTIEL